MYADDTTLVSTLENFGALNNIAVIEDEINREITKISHWLHSNKLLLNTAKSKFMVFFKHPKAIPKLKLTNNDNPIEQVTEFNFLGITIDQNVTWNAHITKTSIKITRVIGILHKLRHSFPQRILRLIYNSLIHPHLIYGLYLWGFNPKRLTILQKRAVRILALRPYLSHSTPLFKSLKIPKLEDLYIIQLYKLYYKNVNNLLPSYLLLLSTHSSLIIRGSPLLLSYGGSPPASPASYLAGLLRRRDPSTNPGPIAWWVSVGN